MDEALRTDLREAVALYNRGDYLTAQEHLEEVYAGLADERDRALLKGLAAVACAMHLHFRRGGGKGVLNLLRQSLFLLDELRPSHAGVQVEELWDALDAYLADLKDRRKPGAGFLDRWLAPRIRIVD
jgi:predicted metal-dependent hydrolase